MATSRLEFEEPAHEIRTAVLGGVLSSGFTEAVRLTVHETAERPALSADGLAYAGNLAINLPGEIPALENPDLLLAAA